MEEAATVDVPPNSDVRHIDIAIRPYPRHTIRGRVRLSGTSNMPAGQLRVVASNDWHFNLNGARHQIVAENGTFEIPGLYPGKVRLTVHFVPSHPGDYGAWCASIPEILVPEQAADVVIELRKKTWIDRTFRWWYSPM
ncbi:MAG: carboxypeptidase regulatory-like domain-containing protein [Acidobacteria bacterium]|nr:carboxypeptidase regulatory-like domain-containing protein [Acidobacteriota bacterium]